MGEKKLRSIKEIKEAIKEPDFDHLEKFAKISDDKKSLLIRIPQDIRKKLGIKPGDKIRFYSEFKEDNGPKLEIDWVSQDA
jgi:hypothetical protein